jgi:asparagine synthetase B (glutamine-hydrolysing)
MCGICGYVSFRAAPFGAGAAARVEAMLAALAHRGPDASALHAAGPAVVGATRLAIRGLADGRQPLVDAESGVVAVCNGEIDNHRELKAWLAERGRPVAQATDVAVIPGLYLEVGDAFPEWLVGAFAIGLWDPRRHRLVLTRDRAGEKPLFFCTAPDDQALFATELAALALAVSAADGSPPPPAPEALAHYLRFGCFAAPSTPFAGFQKVGPGERVVLDAAGVHRVRYWRWRAAPSQPGQVLGNAAAPVREVRQESSAASVPQPATPPAAPGPGDQREHRADRHDRHDRDDRADRHDREHREPRDGRAAALSPARRLEVFDQVFRQAIARQIDVEVPCGVFLSGGVDSSLVTAVARSVQPDLPLRAFSLRFAEASFDEGEVAARVGRHLGLATTEVWVGPEDFIACLPELVRMAGEPLADPAWVPAALLARRAASEVKQVLVGEGGDELFGGYPTHSGVGLAEAYARLPRGLRRIAAAAVARLPPSDKKVTLSFLLKRFVAGDGLEGLERHLLWTSNIAPEVLARLGVSGSAGAAGRGLWAAAPPAGGSLLDRVQQHDLEATLAEGLLTKADRASMHYALELRAPFLDRDVMELAATLPERDRVRRLATKVFLKRYALRYLPSWVVHRRKRGLSVPLTSWLRGPLRGWAEERLTSGRLSEVGVDPAAARDLFGEHLRRERDHARALWTLVVLAEWLEWAAGLQSPTSAGSAAQPGARRAPLPAAAAEEAPELVAAGLGRRA